MNLDEIEARAEAFTDKQAELEETEAEVEELITELRDKPKQAARETEFAQFVGADSTSAEEVEAMEQRKDELADKRDELLDEIDEDREELMEAFVSEDLVVPLTMDPEQKDREWVFSFRGEETYPNAIEFLGETVGLGNPIRVEGVLISEKGVRVPIEEYEMDESEAMETVMAAFEQLQNTLEMKLPDDDGW
jgi:hypothetical protein